MKKLILISLATILCLSIKAQTKTDTVTSENWKYSERTNEMTNKKSYYAETYSSILDDGTNTALTVRYLKDENDVLFTIGKALFNTGIGDYEIQVKFDDGKIEKYRCDKAANNDFQTVFVHKANEFIKRLKSAKIVLIQCNIYQRGDMVFHFDLSGLKWEH
jgi:hypothetical protein